MRTSPKVLALVAAFGLGGCATRVPKRVAPAPAPAPTASRAAPLHTEAQTRAGLEAVKQAKPYFPLLSDEAAHKAMPTMFKGRPMPTLLYVAGLMPKSMEAVMNVSRAVHTEGDLDGDLLNDVFWAVSSSNECFY